MRKSWRFRIRDILKAIENVEEFTKGLNEAAFCDNTVVVHAVLHNLEIIGEAANHIPERIVSKYANLPWDDIRGLRNVIAHEYYRVRLPLIWQTVSEGIPELRVVIVKILETEPED